MDGLPGDAGTPPTPEPRTFAESLGLMSDESLVTLFRARPDLVRQLPEDLATLAGRCASPVSVRLIWDRLTALEQQVIEVLVAHRSAMSPTELRAALDPQAAPALSDAIDSAVRRCADVALIWGGDDGLRVVTTAASLVGHYPCGLDPADRSGSLRISRYTQDPASFFDELAMAPAGARAALDRLVWGPPRGSVPNADRVVSAASASTPIEWLLARGMLVPAGHDSVVLPRELALLLRGGRYVRQVAAPPDPPSAPDAAAVADADATAGMHALLVTRTVGRLLDLLDSGGIRMLRSGGIYQRDAAELARRLRLTLAQTALVADVAFCAGLIDADAESGVWGLTRTADAWRVLSEPRQWTALALAWRDSSSHAPLAADEADNRILSEALHAPSIAEIRRLVLEVAATVPTAAAIEPDRLLTAIGWYRPRLNGRDLPQFATGIVADGEFLGVFGRGALSRAGRLLVDPGSDAGSIAAALRWPAMVEQIVLQADSTATAMGPMTPQAQARVARLADLESTGAGTVYRISADSLVRAFDAGMATAEVLAELQDLSATPVPAAVAALVADVGRRHGSIRVQTAACVVTSDDEAALAAAMADRSLAHLRLHRVAAGVAISPVGPDEVTAALRKIGVAAVSAAAAAPARPRRLPGRRTVVIGPIQDDHLAAAVRSLRAGESARAALTGPDRVAPVRPHDLVQALTAAIREGRMVWLDYSDPTGTRRVRLVEPLTLRGGLLSGFDHRDQRVAGFPLSRIAGISAVAAER